MKAGWNQVSLSEIAAITMGQSPPSEFYNTTGVGLPFFQGCKEFGEFHPVVEKFCSEPKRIAQRGDVLMSVRAPVGTLNIADRRCCIGRGLGAIKGREGGRFIYYLLKANLELIQSFGTGTTYQAVNKGDVAGLPFNIPPPPVQRTIATILSAYDDLIENNLRRIKILEEMAQSLYREWFVKFRFPGHEKVRMVDSPLGKIPEGWEVRTMPEAVEVRPKLPVPKSKQVPFVPMGSLSETSMLVGNFEHRPKASGARFQNSDTLMARITPCLENGKTGFVQFLPTNDTVACGSTEFIVLRSRTVCPEYVYLMARSDPFRDNAIKSMSGATGRQRVREECFDKFLLAQPTAKVLNQFHSIIRPKFRFIHLLSSKNQTLRQTRDLLLPRLISGELDVSDLKIHIPEEAA